MLPVTERRHDFYFIAPFPVGNYLLLPVLVHALYGVHQKKEKKLQVLPIIVPTEKNKVRRSTTSSIIVVEGLADTVPGIKTPARLF